MKKPLLVMSMASLLVAVGVSGPTYARDRAEQVDLSASQMTDQSDAQTARLKADLRLTADQEKNWAGFATAMHDMSQKRATSQIAWRASHPRDAQTQDSNSADLMDQMRQQADSEIERATWWKALADAASPLFTSLDAQQKKRFAAELFQFDR